ncbi:5015_t:CDS:1, partial [Racocetra fulgida]
MRLWFSPPESQCIAYALHTGYDFPISLQRRLFDLNISLTQIQHSDLPSSRGLNTFKSINKRLFEYLTPLIKPKPANMPISYLNSKIFHIIGYPIDVSRYITDILRLRDKQLPPPIFIWEPTPECASGEYMQSWIEAMKLVDIISPNHEEIAAVLGLISEDYKKNEHLLEMLRHMADKLLEHQIGSHGKGCVIIRASRKGCLVATKERKEIIPAYWEPLEDGNENPSVMDVTGAGNSFCGGLMVGLLKSNYDIFKATLYGIISASFTIEQIGVPIFKINEQGVETWNSGDNPQSRLQNLKLRIENTLNINEL